MDEQRENRYLRIMQFSEKILYSFKTICIEMEKWLFQFL